MTTCGYLVRPDDGYVLRVSMGGAPRTHREPVTHPDPASLPGLSPEATHLESTRTDLWAARSAQLRGSGSRVYVFTRALRHTGPLIAAPACWVEVRLFHATDQQVTTETP